MIKKSTIRIKKTKLEKYDPAPCPKVRIDAYGKITFVN